MLKVGEQQWERNELAHRCIRAPSTRDGGLGFKGDMLLLALVHGVSRQFIKNRDLCLSTSTGQEPKFRGPFW